TACRPSAASPTTLNPGWLSRSSLSPLRTTLWSSANKMRICFTSLASPRGLFIHDWQCDGHDRTASSIGVDLAISTQPRHPLLHSEQPHSLRVLHVETSPIVLNGKEYFAAVLLHPNAY